MASFLSPKNWLKHLRGGGRDVNLSYFYILLVVGGTVYAKTVADTVFLAEYPVRILPIYLGAIGLGSVIFSSALFALASRGQSAMRLYGTLNGIMACLGLALTFLAMGGFSEGQGRIVFAFGINIVTVAIQLVAWNVVSSSVHTGQAKEIFPRLAAFATGGGVIGGIIASLVAQNFSTEMSIWLAGFFFILLLPVPFMFKVQGADSESSGARARTTINPFLKTAIQRPGGGAEKPATLVEGLKALKSSPLISFLALITLLLSVVACLADFQFKAVLQTTMAANEIGTYLGGLQAGVNLTVLLVQVFLMSMGKTGANKAPTNKRAG